MRFWGVVIFVAVLGICLGCEDSSSSNDLNEASVDMSRTLTGDARVIEPESDAILISDGGDVESNDAGDLACVPNEGALCIDDMTRRVCNAQGTDYVDETCAEGERCVAGSCAPSTCRVGEHICLDERTIGGCRRDESGYIPIRTCDEDSPCVDGRCNSGCNPLGKIPSNIGCEYWSVDLDNYPDPFSNDPSSVPHAIVISNTSEAPASVTVEGPGGVTLVDPEFVVADGDVHVFTFPRLDIDGTGIFDRAFKISSTQPVIVYQFNPLNNEGVASNDASLLLPKEGLGREYVALSWPSGAPICLDMNPDNCLPPQSGYVTVVATSEGSTIVRVTPTVPVAPGDTLAAMPAGMEQEIVLTQGQVLNLQAQGGDLGDIFSPCMSNEDCQSGICLGVCLPGGEGQSTDLTGTVISASQPVAVFGGHEEAVIGADSPCCAEHLEQQLLPVGSWGTRYLAARTEPRGGSNEHWRVVAQADGTVVQTIPPQPEAGEFTLNRGEFKEIVSADSFEITSSAPVMVGEYLVSQGATQDNVGDPALIITPPINQLRSDYQIIIPQGYSSNWLTIAREAGESITLDGMLVADNLFFSFGSNEYELAWVEVSEGVHYLEGDSPFYLTVYGYSAAVSYGYPGGLNLRSDEL